MRETLFHSHITLIAPCIRFTISGVTDMFLGLQSIVTADL